MRASIGAGVAAATRNLGPVVWTYLASMLSAAPLALAFGMMVGSELKLSLEADVFMRALDPELIAELIRAQLPALALFVPLIAGAVGFWCVLSAFMNGAILVAVSSDQPARTAELLAGGGRTFGRLARLMVMGLPFVALVVAPLAAAALKGVNALTEDWTSERGIVFVRICMVGAVALAAAWAHGAYELMKVEAVAKGEHRARYAFLRGLMRAVRHPLRLLGIYLPFVGGAVLLTALVSLADVRVSRASWAAMAVGAALQQATALVRAGIRVAQLGAQVAWVRGAR